MDNEKERLEKELRFLKESLEANIISEEEFEKGKKRIEKRLDELGTGVEEKEEDLTVGDVKGYGEEKKETATDILDEVEKEAEKDSKKQDDWVTKELKELEEQKLVEPKPKAKAEETKVAEKVEEKPEPKEEKKEERKEEKPKPEPKEEKKEERKEEKPKPEPKKEEKKPKKTVEKEEPEGDEEITPIKINRKTLRIIGIIAIIILFLIVRRAPDSSQDIIPVDDEFIPVCSADEECVESGRVGICAEPGTEEASCEFLEAKEVALTIINDRTCESCDASRMLNILRQLFPGLKGSLVDANSPSGRSLINSLGINVLPAYVFDAEINETVKFDKFKRALVLRGDNYVVSPTASGSNYFFTRSTRPATIDLFVEAGQDTTEIDNSMNEVRNLFGSNIDINRQVIDKADKKSLERELAITTFPAYMINNQLKFTGTQAAEIIKNRFCYLNALPECEATLSVDIVKTG